LNPVNMQWIGDRLRFGTLALVAGLLLAGCGQTVEGPLDGVGALVANREGGNLSLIRDTHPPEVVRDLVQVAEGPVQFLYRDDQLLVLSSTGHGLTVIEPGSWTVLRRYDLGIGCGPHGMALAADGSLLVACTDSNELLRMDPESPDGSDPVSARLSMPEGGALLPFQPGVFGQARPLGVAVAGHRAFVALANLDEDGAETGPGLLLVVDAAAWTADKIIELPAVHPMALHQPAGTGDRLYVSCLPGLVAVVNTASDEISGTVQLDSVPGRMWQDSGGVVWVADQSQGRLMRFLSGDLSVQEPLDLCPGRTPVGDVGSNGRGRFYASCYLLDQVWTFLGSDPESTATALEAGDGPMALWVVQK